MSDADVRARLRLDAYPRSANYDPAWMFETAMGPNVLWLAEALSQVLPLEPGMRVLDLGCGRAASSIFLAREFDVRVQGEVEWNYDGTRLDTGGDVSTWGDLHNYWRVHFHFGRNFAAMDDSDGVSQYQAMKASPIYRYPHGNSIPQSRYFRAARGRGGQA